MFLFDFLPIITFILLYLSSGAYFSYYGVKNAFYIMSPIAAILPAIALGWIISNYRGENSLRNFIEGVRQSDIVTMCLIFLLAGVFSKVTGSIGCIDSIVNFVIAFFPRYFLLIGMFIIAAVVSTAIGTSMGTIATIAPLAVSLANNHIFPMTDGLGAVISGAMFGDSLSLISDTTIAAIAVVDADYKKKFKINFIIAMLAGLITIFFLFFNNNVIIESTILPIGDYNLILILPYLFLIVLSFSGYSVFVSLFISLFFAFIIGFFNTGYGVLDFNNDLISGISSMLDITILSLLIGGLIGLISYAIDKINQKIKNKIGLYTNNKLYGKSLIAFIVGVFDIFFANNTIAIIFSGKFVKTIIPIYNIKKEEAATILDIVSCIFQGIIPWGAQILLASSMGEINPLLLVKKVYFCYFLAIVTILYILYKNK
jgi:Na+/H+ antiporter NhaC